ncbi:MAG: DUF4013 domain-containing protein [Puniceicoccaceae bacterium]|nr:MAG: DUF4013 domain-containing protein [Puniceicoccaceae bacterium]
MVTFEQVLQRVFSDASWFVKTLIGGLLLLIPVVQLFALGYIYRQTDRVRKGESVELADWEDPGGLFVDGARFLLILALFFLLPLFLAWLLTLPLFLLGPLSWLPIIPVLFLGAPATAGMLVAYQEERDFRVLLEVGRTWRQLNRTFRFWFLPNLAFIGFVALGLPLLPFALFIGGVVIFPFFALSIRHVEMVERSTLIA